MEPHLEYSDKHHKYYADGREMISVTQVLNAAGLVNKFCMQEEAAWRGSEVHRLCAEDDGQGLDLRKVPKQFRGYLRAWRQYRIDSGFSPVLIEQRIDDHRNGYAGRLDRVGYRHGQAISTVLDIKTTKTGAIADYVRFQLVAYGHALRPNHLFERIAVALKPNGTYNVKVFGQLDFKNDLVKFLEMLRTVKEKGHANSN